MLPNLSDIMAGLPDVPLSAVAKAYQREILSVPYSVDAIENEEAGDADQDHVTLLHDLALSAPKIAVPQILKYIKRFPHYPTLKNYLMVAYDGMGQKRKADEVLKQIVKEHPDYLFGRYMMAMNALAEGNIDKAEDAIGKGRDIRTAYPNQKLFHVSEMRSFYAVVGSIHARRGETELARGVHAAIKVFDPNPQAAEVVLREILLANVLAMQKRAQMDQTKRITVQLPKLPNQSSANGLPDFQHQIIGCLYEHDINLPTTKIREILTLPRESLVEDLTKVLEDGVARTPEFMQFEEDAWNTNSVFHALHLLAEVDGVEALPSLLRVLALHPDAFDFWLGETSAYSQQLSRIVGKGIPDCVVWLKSPGIVARQKGILCEGMTYLARVDTDRREEISAALTEVLAFMLESPREDNVLDTQFLALLISCLAEIRAENAMPLIETAYRMNLVEDGFVGTLKSVQEDMILPLDPVEKARSVEAEYRYWQNQAKTKSMEDALGDDPENVVRSQFGAQPWSSFGNLPDLAPEPGRNDPCPCGSGKKYKKCCLR